MFGMLAVILSVLSMFRASLLSQWRFLMEKAAGGQEEAGGMDEPEEGKDRISELPDALLQHIMTYMNTEDAIRTGALSKRWKKVWTHAPNLQFAYIHHPKFADFVNQSMLHYRGTRIQKMCLFVYIEQYSRVPAWANFYHLH